MVWLGYLLVEVRVPFIGWLLYGWKVWMFYFNVIIFFKTFNDEIGFCNFKY